MKKLDRYILVLVLYVGYMMHTYSRRVLHNVINYTIKEDFLSAESIGMILTAQQVGYTLCKFVQPFIIDKVKPKIFFTMTMFMSFACILPFSYSSSVYQLMALYWTHGFCLAFAWPSLARMLKQIIPQTEFGFWWSVECTSSNTGAILGSIISTFISDRYGWRSSIQFCALVNVFVGAIVGTVLFSIPIQVLQADRRSSLSLKKDSLSYLDFLRNPLLLSNNIMFFCVYICRYIISDWYQVHLSNLNFPQTKIAGFLSAMEIGGTIGSMAAGISADFFLNHLTQSKNPRLFVIIFCGGLSAATLHMLIFFVNQLTTQLYLNMTGFLFGLFIYGPVAVSGIIAIEGAPPDQQGMSFALNIIFANVAMLVTGYPVSYVGQTYGWKPVLLISYILMVVSTMILMIFRNASSPADLLFHRDGLDGLKPPSIKTVKFTETT